jgi:hypothetical protein
MQSIILAKCHTIFIVKSDSIQTKSQQTKPCFNYTKLIDNNQDEISSLLMLEMNALSWRAITMTNVDFTILYYTILYYTILYYTIPYHTIPYHTIPYHTIPYHTIPYYTIHRNIAVQALQIVCNKKIIRQARNQQTTQ